MKKPCMTDEAKKLLLDVLTACQAIERFAAGRDFAGYQKDEQTIVWIPPFLIQLTFWR